MGNMIIVLKERERGTEVKNLLQEKGLKFWEVTLYGRPLIVTPPGTYLEEVKDLPGVELVLNPKVKYPLASREFKQDDTVVEIGGKARLGGGYFSVIAGPCSVESEEQILAAAEVVKREGGAALRGGAYKPRTNPYSFQGLGEKGLELLAKAREATGLPIVTEVMDTRDVKKVAEVADALQIGARNMQNFPLLKEVSKVDKPVILKRGLGNTTEEWFQASEYILLGGNGGVILCERGIRTFETATRFTLDIAAVPVAKKKVHLPVIVDPSHPAGKRDLVEPLALAGIAAGADGLIVEVHPNPDKALSDAAQQLTFEQFKDLMKKVRALVEVMGKKLVTLQ
ncbi:3-deoxy-7-phosphoheptulonate synthase [Ignicoccus pacificus DSM 13166]|uniref:3-deoxy-7-phosphoheptulonate synthase n=1 Tax=Ignicoccus pacificus DSM 13166 TaxID=940294 RepID=A0A977KB19_9CREN|nr:3-deoxy-7-phosphoheptulonate synthase [Ignicoccus pacificus DSM 13166]